MRDYNTARASIPTVFVASLMGFTEAPYLEFDHSGVAQVNTLREFKTGDTERLQQLLQGAGNKLADGSRVLLEGTAQAGRVLQERLQAVAQTAESDAQVQPAAAATAPTSAAHTQEPPQPQFFYVQANGVPQGPVDQVQLELLFNDGSLDAAHTQIAPAGSNSWQPAKDWLPRETSAQPQ